MTLWKVTVIYRNAASTVFYFRFYQAEKKKKEKISLFLPVALAQVQERGQNNG